MSKTEIFLRKFLKSNVRLIWVLRSVKSSELFKPELKEGSRFSNGIVAIDVCNPDGLDVVYLWAFWLWLGVCGASLLILLFIIIMCCTGCHF